MAICAMAYTLNYRLCLASKPSDSLIGNAMTEMKTMSLNGIDCWLYRTDKMQNALPNLQYSESSDRKTFKYVQSKFEQF